MQIKIKIIPDDGPNESHEFTSFPDAIKFIIEREPEDHEYIKIPSGSQAVNVPVRSETPDEREVPIRLETTIGNEPPLEKPGFIRRLFRK